VTSPCSVPPWLRGLIREESPRQQQVCAQHDADYRVGGPEHGRAIADARLLLGLLLAGMDCWLAERYYAAVREYGASHFAARQPLTFPPLVVPPQAP